MKRICLILLSLILLLGLFPNLTLRSQAASSQVYYPVDFSAAMYASGIGQQNEKDCAIVSAATAEAYFYGATSSPDRIKVYNAVISMNYNNKTTVQDWDRLGYKEISTSLTDIYNEIAQGNPVLVHRKNSSTRKEHWAVVCGYKGSSSALESSGFLVVDPRRNYTVVQMRLDKWLEGYNLVGALKRRSGVAVTNLGGIRIAANYLELVHIQGEGHGVYGRVTSDANLTNVTVTVTNYDTDAVIYSKSVNPASKVCTLVDTFDASMKFADWSVGRYLYKITATDANNCSETFLKYFTIASSYPAAAPKSPIYNAAFSWNDSQTNYLHGTDFANGVPYGWSSRDTTVATISVDTGVTHNEYASLKIYNKSAGSSGKDVEILTQTNNRIASGWVGDNKTMILSFWAKSSVAGTKLYARWGFETTSRSVELSTAWKQYTIRMDKTTDFGNNLYLFANKAGTVWITEVQLEDGTSATEFLPDHLAVYKNVTEVYGKKYVLPTPDPTVPVFEFVGWYTAKKGGTQITENTIFPEGNIRLYARWKLKTPFKGISIPWPGPVSDGNYTGMRHFPFVDVSLGKYYFEPVVWAYFHDPRITGGTDDTHFSPNQTCTRAQVVSFLWNAKGKPEPDTGDNPFVDVKPSKYYYKAVLWAYQTGVTKGADDTHFNPNGTCTRAHVVSFLWNALGKPEPDESDNPFVDVKPSKFFYKPVLWAYQNGVTKGSDATHFSPNQTCTRGQAVTFLYNTLAK